MAQPLFIFGASYLEPLKVIAAINARAPRFDVRGFIDDDAALHGRDIEGVRVLGGRGTLERHACGGETVFFHNVGGNPGASVAVATLMREAGCRFTSLIHPDVDARGVELGTNCFLPEGCLLGHGARLGDFVACRLGAVMSHDVSVGNHVSISIRATVAGYSVIEDECFLGASSTIVGVRVGRGSVVGAGAVVLDDVAPGTTVVGIPARPVVRGRR
jgi:sugar O-acyltransferase (sialic acid O-acetyltransferase NeuD family)